MSSFTEQCFSPTGLTLLTLNPLLFTYTLICFYNINFPRLTASNGTVRLNMQWAGNKFSGFRFSHHTQSAISLQSQIQNTLGIPKSRDFKIDCPDVTPQLEGISPPSSNMEMKRKYNSSSLHYCEIIKKSCFTSVMIILYYIHCFHKECFQQ